MSHSGDGDDVPAEPEQQEANIRWLLAAVLHHQPEDDDPPEGDA
jgi:hypothetical protein